MFIHSTAALCVYCEGHKCEVIHSSAIAGFLSVSCHLKWCSRALFRTLALSLASYHSPARASPSPHLFVHSTAALCVYCEGHKCEVVHSSCSAIAGFFVLTHV